MGSLFQSINQSISNIVWGPPMLIFFLGVGIMFTLRSRFFQLTKVGTWFGATAGDLIKNRHKKNTDSASISQAQALWSSLAACIGTGNIVGVATAIIAGGAGAVFWMWVSAFFGMMTCCAENVLGIKYRVKNDKGQWCGGAMIYMERGLGWKKTSKIFSLLLVLSSFGIGNMTQSNALAQTVHETFGISPLVSGIIVAAVAAVVILGGVKRIAVTTEKIVPVMSVIFLLACAFILVCNRANILLSVELIFKSAFSSRSVLGGVSGYAVAKAVRYGIARGVFSNEAGLGSTAIIHSTADVDSPKTQGMWGILEVFIDTFLICTLTAVTLLSTGLWQDNPSIESAEFISGAFSKDMGLFGAVVLCVCIVLFSFATIVGWSYYGEKGAEHLGGRGCVSVYKLVYLLMIVLGSAVELNVVWDISDTLNALMAIPNLIALCLLSGEAVKEIRR